MRSKMKRFVRSVKNEMRENKNTFMVYLILRLLVVGMMVLQIFNRNFENVFFCLLTLVLMVMPSVVQATFKVEFPSLLEIIILFFIFAAEILGEISAFYMRFAYWDTILHTLNGFLCAAIGFSLVDLLNRQQRQKFEMSPIFLAITAFCFSMTIGVMWEFFEFGMDMLCGSDMQKDTVVQAFASTLLDPTQRNHAIPFHNIQDVTIDGTLLEINGYLDIGLIDTMNDLFVNFVGAIVFCGMGYFYVKKRDSKSLIKGLVPEPWTEEKVELERNSTL